MFSLHVCIARDAGLSELQSLVTSSMMIKL